MAEPIVIRFHRSLYDAAAVDRAVARFGALGTFAVQTSEADVKVTATPIRESVRERLADELSNHALFETILARKGMSA